MELVYCPECGAKVSVNAEGCPNCGYPVKAMYEKNKALFEQYQEIQTEGAGAIDSELMSCPECGIKVSVNVACCPNCGYPIKAMMAPQRAMSSQEQVKLPTTTEISDGNFSNKASNIQLSKKKNRMPIWLKALVIELLLLLLGGIVFLIINSSPEKSLEETKKQRLTINANNVSFDMLLIDGGTFIMGENTSNSEHGGRESPSHRVTLSSFYLSKYEVTQELWEAVMGANPSEFRGAKLPVENVSWYDCQNFINELNRITGKRFRLPTEAEWEYAAKGGSSQENYEFAGSDNLSSVAWSKTNSSNRTHLVGQKDSNGCGLFDMSGNVYEWCGDWYALYSSQSATNPQGPESGTNKVFRGGSWKYSDNYCRVTFRAYTKPSGRYHNLGFRLVLDVEGRPIGENDILKEKSEYPLLSKQLNADEKNMDADCAQDRTSAVEESRTESRTLNGVWSFQSIDPSTYDVWEYSLVFQGNQFKFKSENSGGRAYEGKWLDYKISGNDIYIDGERLYTIKSDRSIQRIKDGQIFSK